MSIIKEGKGGITAEVVADSISCYHPYTRIITAILEYPRFIHSEFMTHRMLSRNAASSRAIPVEVNINFIKNNTAMPVFWGKNQPGMQASAEGNTEEGRIIWEQARDSAIAYAEELHRAGFHKQIVNRILEPFTFMRTIVTATEWDNFFWLRHHPDAQPEFQELATVTLQAFNESTPKILVEGDWHMPFYNDGAWLFRESTDKLQDALMLSSSLCAQISYRKADYTADKARKIYDRLIGSTPVHASPTEHPATPMRLFHGEERWSNNFKNWIQYRELIPNNVCNDYKPLLNKSYLVNKQTTIS